MNDQTPANGIAQTPLVDDMDLGARHEGGDTNISDHEHDRRFVAARHNH
jgi:hypothetical protein